MLITTDHSLNGVANSFALCLQPQYWDWDPLPGQTFCSCAQCNPGAALPAPPQPAFQQESGSGSVATLPLSTPPPMAHPRSGGMGAPPMAVPRGVSDPYPPMPPAHMTSAGHHLAQQAQYQQRTAHTSSTAMHSSSGQRTSARLSSAAHAASGGQGNHAPMDQEVIDVLMNLH